MRLRRENLGKEEVSTNLSRLLTQLKELKVDVEAVVGIEDLSSLIKFVADDDGVPWDTDGVTYLSKTVTASVHTVALNAAAEAKTKGYVKLFPS